MINTTSIDRHTGADSYTDLSSINAIGKLQNKNQALEKIAQQFEAMMLQMMMKSMRSANKMFSEGNYLSSSEGDMYQDMYDDQLALSLSQGKGMGLAEIMVHQLKGRYGSAEKVDGETSVGKINSVAEYLKNRNNYQGLIIYQEPIRFADQSPKDISINGVPEDTTIDVNAPADGTPITFDGSIGQFVEQLYPLAKKAAEQLAIDPEVLLAQSALETGWGKNMSVKINGESSFNFFNIKADKRWDGDLVTVPTMEIRQGLVTKELATFRSYTSPTKSFEDYVEFIRNNSRYDEATNSEDSESYIDNLSAAGYATDPHYASKILRIFHSDGLSNAVKNVLQSFRSDVK